jgi:hypothetical protein
MEMKRLTSRRKNPVLRWIKQNLGLTAWYKYASEYGENYVRPALLLILLLLAFGTLYPALGLRDTTFRSDSAAVVASQLSELQEGGAEEGDIARPSQNPELQDAQEGILTYSILNNAAEAEGLPKWPLFGRLWWNGLISSVMIAMFQKDLMFEPAYPWGRVLMIFEMVLTSTLFALFLLAVRRKFRR